MDQRTLLMLLAMWLALGLMAGVAVDDPARGLAIGGAIGLTLYCCFQFETRGRRPRGTRVKRSAAPAVDEGRFEAIKWFIFLRSVDVFVIGCTLFIMVWVASLLLGVSMEQAAVYFLQ